jgi:phage shock protein E
MLNFLKSLFGGGPKVDYKELVKNGAWIIDVRTPEEFNAGHIQNATNIPLNTLPQRMAEIKKKGKKVITVCRSGSRSGMAKSLMINQGIEAFNGGAWTTFKHKIA